MGDYCSQLENIPKEGESIWNSDLYKCRITGRRCIASTYEDPDPGHPGSREEAYYHDGEARSCPAYNATDEMAAVIKGFKLRLEREKKEKYLEKLEAELKKITEGS
ncbi:MAG: hypothetical protein ACE5J7_01780 [Candidatus Aenigmatarchaeota archaeon]